MLIMVGKRSRSVDKTSNMPLILDKVVELKQRFPGRETQIEDLVQVLTSLSVSSSSHPMMISGPRGTGKTAMVRETVEALNIPHVYVSCYETKSAKDVYSAILEGLMGLKRHKREGYASTVRCGSLSEFLELLPEAIRRYTRTPWVIVDAAHRLNDDVVFSTLTRAQSAMRYVSPTIKRTAKERRNTSASRKRNSEGFFFSPRKTVSGLGIIFISSICWSSGHFVSDGIQAMHPHEIHFSSYRPIELQKILMQRLPSDDPIATASVYRQFLTAIVSSLARSTENVNDLQTAAEKLWPLYSAPLREGKEVNGARLFARIRSSLGSIVSDLDLVHGSEGSNGPSKPINDSQQMPMGIACSFRKAMDKGESGNSIKGVNFELPYVSKFILLAAYIASHNKPTADREIFDPGFSSGRRRKDAFAMDKQAEAAQSSVFQGPHQFPLERLLHIFYCIYEHHGYDAIGQTQIGDEFQFLDGTKSRTAAESIRSKRLVHEVQRAEIGLQISTLVSLNFLSRQGSDILENAQYRCHISDDLARTLATNVKLRLNDYLKLA